MGVERLGVALRAGSVTARALAEKALAAAAADPCGAFVLVTADIARNAAAAADRELAVGTDRGPLHGIPLAVKDVVDVAGLPTRVGTSAFGHRTATADADVWRALREAGAVLIGKTRLPELALDVVTPGTVNPRDATRTSGGSSGGSAAAVASRIVPLALGTDTGGSIRIPAALTGVAGLRPTHGVISLRGVRGLSPSQDTVGFIARGIRDCLIGYEALAGTAVAARDSVPPERRSLRIGIPTGMSAARQVAAAFSRAVRALAAAGHELRRCDMPLADTAPGISYLVMVAEAAALWPAGDDVGLGERVAGHLRAGRALADRDLRGARDAAAALRHDLVELLTERVDVLAMPTTAATAVPDGACEVLVDGDWLPVATAYCRFTTLASATGLPAVSVPCGVDDAGLPVGLQLVAGPHREPLLGRLAADVEAWYTAAPA